MNGVYGYRLEDGTERFTSIPICGEPCALGHAIMSLVCGPHSDQYELSGDDDDGTSAGLLQDSAHCDWAYCLNFEDGLFEVYSGCSLGTQRRLGRYARSGVSLIASIPLRWIPSMTVAECTSFLCHCAEATECIDVGSAAVSW